MLLYGSLNLQMNYTVAFGSPASCTLIHFGSPRWSTRQKMGKADTQGEQTAGAFGRTQPQTSRTQVPFPT